MLYLSPAFWVHRVPNIIKPRVKVLSARRAVGPTPKHREEVYRVPCMCPPGAQEATIVLFARATRRPRPDHFSSRARDSRRRHARRSHRGEPYGRMVLSSGVGRLDAAPGRQRTPGAAGGRPPRGVSA